jgi:hypothetical protein
MSKPGVENKSSSETNISSKRSSADDDHMPRQRNRIGGAVGIGTGTVPAEERALASALLKALFGAEDTEQTSAEQERLDLEPDDAANRAENPVSPRECPDRTSR